MEELKESAAHAGALWTISLLKSWYPAVELNLLMDTFRNDDTYAMLKYRPDFREVTCTIMDFVDFSEFIPDRVAASSDCSKEDTGVMGKGISIEEDTCSKVDPANAVEVPNSSKAAP